MDNFQIAILSAQREEEKLTIGVRQEKILHRTIKYYLEPNEKFHEIKIGKNVSNL